MKEPRKVLFELEQETHMKFKEIALRERRSMSEIVRGLIADYIKRASETPNPQTALTGPPFPNIWLETETAWEHLDEYPADMLEEMDRLARPRVERVREILDRGSAKKHVEADPDIKRIKDWDIDWLINGKGMTRDQAVEHLKRQGFVE